MFYRVPVVIVANLACACFTGSAILASSLTLVGAGMVISNDPGGPMFVPIAALCALFAAGYVAGTLFAVTLIVEGLRRLARARWWVASLVAVPAVAATAAGVALWYGATAVWTVVAATAAFAAFGAYWHAYLGAQVLFSRIAERLFPDRPGSA